MEQRGVSIALLIVASLPAIVRSLANAAIADHHSGQQSGSVGLPMSGSISRHANVAVSHLSLRASGTGTGWALAPPRSVGDSCIVVVGCVTGMGDVLMDVISGVAIARLIGCGVSTVRTHWSIDERHYDWPRHLRSPHFHMVAARRCEQCSYAYHDYNVIVPRQGMLCGQHGMRWLRNVMPHHSDDAIRTSLLAVARSITVVPMTPPPADIGERVAIHVRRGDKLNRFSSEGILDQLYRAVPQWLSQHGYTQVFLATDDATWGQRWARLLENTSGLDVAFAGSNATAYDDIVAMAGSKIILKASTGSQFSMLAAILSGNPLFSLTCPERVKDNMTSEAIHINALKGISSDRTWEEAGLLDLRVFNYCNNAQQRRQNATQPTRLSRLLAGRGLVRSTRGAQER